MSLQLISMLLADTPVPLVPVVSISVDERMAAPGSTAFA
jgi:hypothetical protein